MNEEMYSARLRLLGHILRMNYETPAKTTMLFYFNTNAKPLSIGRPRTTLPVSIDNNLKKYTRNIIEKKLQKESHYRIELSF